MPLPRTRTCKSSKHLRAWMCIWALDLVSTVLWRTLTYSTQVEWLYAILAWLHGEDISSVNASRQMQIVCVLWVEDGAHRASIATPEQRSCLKFTVFKTKILYIIMLDSNVSVRKLNAYLSKVGTPGTLEYREIFLIYREIFEKSYFFKKFWSWTQKARDMNLLR